MNLTQNESYISGPHNHVWTELIENNCGIFVVKKLYFVNFLHPIWTWTSH